MSKEQEAYASFFAAAEAFFAARPWMRLESDELVHVEALELGIEDGCVSVVGASEEVRGFAFYRSYEDCERAGRGDFAELEGLYFSFDARDEATLEQYAGPLAEQDAYPMLRRLVNQEPAPLRAGDLPLATGILRGIATLSERHQAACEAYGEEDVRVESVEAGLSLALTIPHPEALEALEAPPRAPTLSVHNPYALPLSERDLTQLERLLDAVMLHRAIGLFCAAASVPRLPPPSEWLGELLQGTPSAEAAKAAAGLLMRVYNHVVTAVSAGGIDSLVPEAADHDACRSWARGYLSMLMRDKPRFVDKQADECAMTILAVSELSPRQVDDLDAQRESLADAAAYLFEHWAPSREAPPEPIRRETPKVGRNDPCPCGSGKKHKKCCGAAA